MASWLLRGKGASKYIGFAKAKLAYFRRQRHAKTKWYQIAGARIRVSIGSTGLEKVWIFAKFLSGGVFDNRGLSGGQRPGSGLFGERKKYTPLAASSLPEQAVNAVPPEVSALFPFASYEDTKDVSVPSNNFIKKLLAANLIPEALQAIHARTKNTTMQLDEYFISIKTASTTKFSSVLMPRLLPPEVATTSLQSNVGVVFIRKVGSDYHIGMVGEIYRSQTEESGGTFTYGGVTNVPAHLFYNHMFLVFSVDTVLANAGGTLTTEQYDLYDLINELPANAGDPYTRAHIMGHMEELREDLREPPGLSGFHFYDTFRNSHVIALDEDPTVIVALLKVRAKSEHFRKPTNLLFPNNSYFFGTNQDTGEGYETLVGYRFNYVGTPGSGTLSLVGTVAPTTIASIERTIEYDGDGISSKPDGTVLINALQDIQIRNREFGPPIVMAQRAAWWPEPNIPEKNMGEYIPTGSPNVSYRIVSINPSFVFVTEPQLAINWDPEYEFLESIIDQLFIEAGGTSNWAPVVLTFMESNPKITFVLNNFSGGGWFTFYDDVLQEGLGANFPGLAALNPVLDNPWNANGVLHEPPVYEEKMTTWGGSSSGSMTYEIKTFKPILAERFRRLRSFFSFGPTPISGGSHQGTKYTAHALLEGGDVGFALVFTDSADQLTVPIYNDAFSDEFFADRTSVGLGEAWLVDLE